MAKMMSNLNGQKRRKGKPHAARLGRANLVCGPGLKLCQQDAEAVASRHHHQADATHLFPSPGLEATLSPSDGERDRVRGLQKSCRPDSICPRGAVRRA